MGYAKRLVEMSRASVGPTIQPIELRDVATEVAPPGTAVAPLATVAAIPPPPTVMHHVDDRAPRVTPPVEAATMERTPGMREVARTTLAAPMNPTPIAPRIAEPPDAGAAVTRVGAPPAIQPWLAERPDRIDPLDSMAGSDELRDVLRAVRRWTSAAPVAAAEPTVAPPKLPAAVDAPDVPEHGEPAADPGHHVSIGNVTITVEDPAGRATRSPAGSRRDPTTRLARHYVRGE
jgi:hypothetical protein